MSAVGVKVNAAVSWTSLHSSASSPGRVRGSTHTFCRMPVPLYAVPASLLLQNQQAWSMMESFWGEMRNPLWISVSLNLPPPLSLSSPLLVEEAPREGAVSGERRSSQKNCVRIRRDTRTRATATEPQAANIFTEKLCDDPPPLMPTATHEKCYCENLIFKVNLFKILNVIRDTDLCR